MSALSEALSAAQRSALGALEKAYVAERIDAERLTEQLAACGITDPVDLAFLLAALDVLRELGVAAPTMTERVVEAKEQATDKQLDYITKLFHEGKAPGQVMPDHLSVLTKEQASEIIDSLQKGSYDGAKWSVPF